MEVSTITQDFEQRTYGDEVIVEEEKRIKMVVYRIIKRFFDMLISLILLIVLSPLFLLISLLIKMESKGRVIHGRVCVGKHGNYIMYKFRSMVEDADNLEKYLTKDQIMEYKKEVKIENDPRITRIGKFIRKTSIDELPQLINVLKGEMSLVGPRPTTSEDAVAYGDALQKVLSVKPGITGYWQTNGRNDVTYSSGERQKLELYYVDNCSVLLDIKILFKTIGVVIGKKGVS